MSLLFIIIIAAGLPFLTAQSYKNIKKMEAEMEGAQIAKIPVYLQSMVMQIILCVLAYFAARSEKIEIPFSNFNYTSIGAAVALIGIALGIAWLSQKFSKEKDESTLHHILPDTNSERMVWILACVVAAFCEEYIYRGVLFQMIMGYMENIWWLAAVLSAVVFAFGHGTQGERAIIQIIPFAVGFQFLAWISGGLILPMIAHFIYNILVEVFFGDKIKRDAA
jgi:membrane protease YdiL (CAAX protease family)